LITGRQIGTQHGSQALSYRDARAG
jgi:hypothetical protein